MNNFTNSIHFELDELKKETVVTMNQSIELAENKERGISIIKELKRMIGV